MPCGILVVLIRGEFMKNKGLTLIEVILSITLIGLIAVSFLPMITFGFRNTIESGKFTDILFQYQEEMENEIDNLRDIDPNDGGVNTLSFQIFGQDVVGHNISIDDDSSGEINMFLPMRTLNEIIPEIESPPVIDVRENNMDLNPSPEDIDLDDDRISLFVHEIDITSETADYYLMSVYRWYMSSEMDISQTPSDSSNDYFIVKEWNEAKKQLSFGDSSSLKFIPNIKDDYNTISLNDVKESLNLSDEDFINTFGNRYIRYGVTPYSLRGRIGKEELSNVIYVNAARIELLDAIFVDEDKVVLSFKEEISHEIDTTNIRLNESLGPPLSVYRDDLDYKRLIMEFADLDRSEDIAGNVILRGAVQSEEYGKISIWHNGRPEGEFTIYDLPPVPVTSVTIVEDDMTIDIGQTVQLTATVEPADATNKEIIWTSDEPGIASVNSLGQIMGLSDGTAVIKAESDADSTIFDQITLIVMSEGDRIIGDLIDALRDVNLTVNSPTSGSPTIDVPGEDDGISYTFTDSSIIQGGGSITINGSGTRATISRPGIFSSTASGTITLRASKGGYSKQVNFPLSIPSSALWGSPGQVIIGERGEIFD